MGMYGPPPDVAATCAPGAHVGSRRQLGRVGPLVWRTCTHTPSGKTPTIARLRLSAAPWHDGRRGERVPIQYRRGDEVPLATSLPVARVAAARLLATWRLGIIESCMRLKKTRAVLLMAGLATVATSCGPRERANPESTKLDRHGQQLTGLRLESLSRRPEQLCSASFSAKPQQSLAGRGILRGGMLNLVRQRGGEWQRDFSFDAFGAESADDLRYLFCVDREEKQVGVYYPDIPAIRVAWNVRLVSWPDGRLLAMTRFQGPKPASEVTAGYTPSTITSNPNEHDVLAWLQRVSDDRSFIAASGATIAFHPDGQHLLIGQGSEIRLWELVKAAPAQRVLSDFCCADKAALIDGGARCVSTSSQGVKAQVTQSGSLVYEARGPWHEAPELIALAANGSTVAAAEKTAEGTRLWVLDAKTGAQRNTQMTIGLWEGLALSQDGKWLLCSTKGTQPTSHRVEFRSIPDLQKIRELTIAKPEFTQGNALTGLALSPNGRRLAMLWGLEHNNSGADLLEIWALDTGHLLKMIRLGSGRDMAFSPDGQKLAVTTNDATFLLSMD